MLIVGYCFGIRSERRLCEEVHLNLAYRWFCGLGLEDAITDHSTFSKNRHGRFRDNDTLRFVFEKVLQRCLAEKLVGGEGFATDASVIKADANRQRGVPGAEVQWLRENRSSRTYPSGTRPNARTVRSAGQTFSGTQKPMSTAARRTNHCAPLATQHLPTFLAHKMNSCWRQQRKTYAEWRNG